MTHTTLDAIMGLAFGGLICALIWYFAPDAKQDARPQTDVTTSTKSAQTGKTERPVGLLLAGAGIIFILWFAAGVAALGFLLLLAYGVAVIIFRAAFGIELPRPPFL